MLMIRRGFRATSEPSNFESIVARGVRNFAIPRRERNEKNPLVVNSQTLTEAREHFMARCSICHGIDGRGGRKWGGAFTQEYLICSPLEPRTSRMVNSTTSLKMEFN